MTDPLVRDLLIALNHTVYADLGTNYIMLRSPFSQESTYVWERVVDEEYDETEWVSGSYADFHTDERRIV